MNERIRELHNQACRLDMKHYPNAIPDGERIQQKFAELIVRECVKFCEHESNDDEHDEYDMGMWVKAESIKTAIMEEFGIKE
jgi:hypothetical protein